MQWSTLDAPFGAEIHLDVDARLSAQDGKELRHLLAEHGLLVSRGAEISREIQIDLVSRHAAGGNLVMVGDILLIASGDHLYAFNESGITTHAAD